jgi:hypothetical protein
LKPTTFRRVAKAGGTSEIRRRRIPKQKFAPERMKVSTGWVPYRDVGKGSLMVGAWSRGGISGAGPGEGDEDGGDVEVCSDAETRFGDDAHLVRNKGFDWFFEGSGVGAPRWPMYSCGVETPGCSSSASTNSKSSSPASLVVFSTAFVGSLPVPSPSGSMVFGGAAALFSDAAVLFTVRELPPFFDTGRDELLDSLDSRLLVLLSFTYVLSASIIPSRVMYAFRIL